MTEHPPSADDQEGIASPFTLQEKGFLEGAHLSEAYTVDPQVKELIEKTVTELKAKYPDEFYFLTLAGGQSNGSYVLRKLQNKKFGSDIDLYIGGVGATEKTLTAIAKDIRQGTRPSGLGIDGLLSGERKDRYLDLSQIPKHIENGDFDLLALPFRCAFGRVKEAQSIVLENIAGRQDEQFIWEEIRKYYQQSLSLHNGQWSEKFNQEIANQYREKKLDKFSLPHSPREFLQRMSPKS